MTPIHLAASPRQALEAHRHPGWVALGERCAQTPLTVGTPVALSQHANERYGDSGLGSDVIAVSHPAMNPILGRWRLGRSLWPLRAGRQT